MSHDSKSNKQQLKDQQEFFAKAIHELRTPLTAINGYSELLHTGNLSIEEAQSFGQIIHRNASYILQLVDALLDISKLNSRKFELASEAFNLFSLFDDIEEVCKPRAEEKGISFGIEFIFPLPREIIGDVMRLKQALLNLAINAVKFTEKGGVKILAVFDSSCNELQLKVVDTGIGLSEQQQHTVFSAFTQGSLDITKEFGGTGLGLLISKELINEMGGTLELRSELGQGSTFSIRLPLESNQVLDLETALPIGPHKPASLKRFYPTLTGNVLVIEDDPDTANLVKYLIEKWGASVTVADNGRKGLMLAQKGEVDLVLLDQNLPFMDGPTVAAKLNEIGFDKPILAFSAERGDEEQKWITESDLAGSVPKPFRHSDLYAIMQNYLGTVSDSLASGSPIFSILLDQGREYRAIIQHFVDGLPDRLEVIQKAISQDDRETVVAEAHKLANGGAFGFPLMRTVAISLERAAATTSTPDLLLQLSELEALVARIIKGME